VAAGEGRAGGGGENGAGAGGEGEREEEVMGWDRKVPFDKKGNLLHYPEWWHERDGIDWREQAEFTDALVFMDYSRGRSAAYLNFQSTTTRAEYPIFLTDIGDVLPRMVHGKIEGRWLPTKRGQNFGLKLVLESPAAKEPR
jgi:hypothetical protein